MRNGATATVRWWSAVVAGVLFTTLLVLTGNGGKLLHLREASGSTYLCTDYSGCNKAGYSDSGYGAVNSKMYWRMYPGHNCVNYVAYRMIQAGMPTARPWTGNGNAANWGHAMESITNQTPAVGAVAWWDAYHHVGSAGHVAYVEKVNSPSDIVISEDSWSGTFHWQHLTKSGGFWPSGFIHFKDKPTGPVLANTTKPSVTGTPQVGKTLAANVGKWSGGPTGYTYSWTAGGVAIAGATSSHFVPTAAQVGKTIAVSVTATHKGSTAVKAASTATKSVLSGAFLNPGLPVISGVMLVGQTLTATGGSFSPVPTKYSYRWQADGKPIADATTPTLTLTPELLGKVITFASRARSVGYTDLRSTSAATTPVNALFTVTQPYSISGVQQPGHTLTAVGQRTPEIGTVAYQWMRDGVAVPGATRSTYALHGGDLGHRIRLRVTLAAPYYRTQVVASRTPALRSPAHIKVRAVGRKGSAVIHVHVGAAYTRNLNGKAFVQVGQQKTMVDVVNGSAVVPFDGLKSGKRWVHVFFWQTATTTRANYSDYVTVR